MSKLLARLYTDIRGEIMHHRRELSIVYNDSKRTTSTSSNVIERAIKNLTTNGKIAGGISYDLTRSEKLSEINDLFNSLRNKYLFNNQMHPGTNFEKPNAKCVKYSHGSVGGKGHYVIVVDELNISDYNDKVDTGFYDPINELVCSTYLDFKLIITTSCSNTATGLLSAYPPHMRRLV